MWGPFGMGRAAADRQAVMMPGPDAIAAAGAGASGRALILSANPINDTGGGQRSAMLARELLHRDWAVVFVSHGRVTETVDLQLRFDHPRLVETPLESIAHSGIRRALDEFLDAAPALVITQVPVLEWLPVVERARRAGATTVYDCVDRWASELGRGWYRPEAEGAIARASHMTTASAPALVDHVERLTGLESLHLPNAFNARLFHADAMGTPRPEGLPSGRVALYVGALWGRWMDWELVRVCAEAYPETEFVFIGDHRREGRGLPRNCSFLGLQPQSALAPYLAHAEVAFLPWKVNAVTQATSPLKVYEFGAMRLPVVAPDLEPLRGMPGIRLCTTTSAFVDAIGRHGRGAVEVGEADAMDAFAELNSWGARVDRLLEGAAVHGEPAKERTSGVPGAPAVHVGARLSVVVPSFNHERWVGSAVASAREQTLSADEIVVVDDGSTDGSRDVLAGLSGGRVRLVLQENRGAHHALNRAIMLARGEWIAILNSDDLFDPERLEHAWGVARATGAGLLCGAVRLIDAAGAAPDPGHEIVRWYAEARAAARSMRPLRAALTTHNVAVTTSNFFMHRELWRRVGGFRAWRYVHDWDFLLRAAALCPRRLVYEDALCDVRYRVHEGNTISESRERAGLERSRMLRGLRSPVSRLRLHASRPATSRAIQGAVGRDGFLSPPMENDASSGWRDGRGLHVGIVVPSLDAGGLEETVALLAQCLPAIGLKVSILCTEHGGAVADRLRNVGVSVRLERGGPAAWAAWGHAARVDLVSTHFAPGSVVAAFSSAGIPVVETVQNCYAWFGEPEWRAERVKGGGLAGVVAVSEVAAAYYGRHAGRSADAVVPNAVHPGRVAIVPRSFARARLDVEPHVPLFVSVARLTEQKNPAGLLRAFARARAEAPDARLMLVGPREKSARLSSLRRSHSDLFRSGAVRYVGASSDIGVVLSAADAFVSNSYYEGWSLAGSEAIWAGLPVVLSETGGARELVGPAGERGILVPNPCGDPLDVDARTVASPDVGVREANEGALAAALVTMARDRDTWRGRAESLRLHARVHLGPDAFARRWAEALGAIHERARSA
jgi:glycosyltransferase involved in cell wall biosynthesis